MPQETAEEVAARISRLPLLEQFRAHHIVSIETEELVTGIGMLARIHSRQSRMLRWYRVVTEIRHDRVDWPMIVGHELGHASEWALSDSEHYLTKVVWHTPEEEFCDAFAEAWLKLGTNRQETETILAQVTPDKPFIIMPEGYAVHLEWRKACGY